MAGLGKLRVSVLEDEKVLRMNVVTRHNDMPRVVLAVGPQEASLGFQSKVNPTDLNNSEKPSVIGSML